MTDKQTLLNRIEKLEAALESVVALADIYRRDSKDPGFAATQERASIIYDADDIIKEALALLGYNPERSPDDN